MKQFWKGFVTVTVIVVVFLPLMILTISSPEGVWGIGTILTIFLACAVAVTAGFILSAMVVSWNSNRIFEKHFGKKAGSLHRANFERQMKVAVTAIDEVDKFQKQMITTVTLGKPTTTRPMNDEELKRWRKYTFYSLKGGKHERGPFV